MQESTKKSRRARRQRETQKKTSREVMKHHLVRECESPSEAKWNEEESKEEDAKRSRGEGNVGQGVPKYNA